MDEPTNNLGVPEQHKVLELIRKLRDQGVPVILITHTLPDVFAVSDRLMVMHRGRKVTEKRTADTSTAGARAVHGRRARRHALGVAAINAPGRAVRLSIRQPAYLLLPSKCCGFRASRSTLSRQRTLIATICEPSGDFPREKLWMPHVLQKW